MSIVAQKMGCSKFPREISHFKTWPGFVAESAPDTKITSANPDEIYEYAEIIALVPELHRCSIE